MRRYVIVADDLTGANDTGIQFLKAGCSSSVVLDPAALPGLEYGAAVVDTESRNVGAEEARTILERVILYLEPLKGSRIVYKKVDSTLRGNIGVEVGVLRQNLTPSLTVFTPAYPANGRTVRNGLCLLDGVPVAETEIGRDPRRPVLSSSLAETVDPSGEQTVRSVSLEELRSESLPALARQEKGHILAFDVETPSDLRRIVAGVTQVFSAEEILWVGSAGLAEALVAPSPVLLVVGSLSGRSREQSRQVLEGGLVDLVSLDVAKLNAEPDAAVKEALDTALALTRRGRNVLLASVLEERQIEVGRRTDAGIPIARALAEVAAQLVERMPLSGLFVTGGEIAVHVLRALGGTGMELLDELEPGVPLVRLSGGRHGGLPMVTKAGGFGTEGVMVRAIEVFEGREIR